MFLFSLQTCSVDVSSFDVNIFLDDKQLLHVFKCRSIKKTCFSFKLCFQEKDSIFVSNVFVDLVSSSVFIHLFEHAHLAILLK